MDHIGDRRRSTKDFKIVSLPEAFRDACSRPKSSGVARFYVSYESNCPLSMFFKFGFEKISLNKRETIKLIEYNPDPKQSNHTAISAIDPFSEMLDTCVMDNEDDEIIVVGADDLLVKNDYIIGKINTIIEEHSNHITITIDDSELLPHIYMKNSRKDVEFFLVDAKEYNDIRAIARYIFARASAIEYLNFDKALAELVLPTNFHGEISHVPRLLSDQVELRASGNYRDPTTGLLFPPVPHQSWTEYAKTLPAPGRGRKRDPSAFIRVAYNEYIAHNRLYYPHLKASDVSLYNAVWSFVGRSGGAVDLETFYSNIGILTPSDIEAPSDRNFEAVRAIININVHISGRKSVDGHLKTRASRRSTRSVGGVANG